MTAAVNPSNTESGVTVEKWLRVYRRMHTI
jgi:hypothetical protein